MYIYFSCEAELDKKGGQEEGIWLLAAIKLYGELLQTADPFNIIPLTDSYKYHIYGIANRTVLRLINA